VGLCPKPWLAMKSFFDLAQPMLSDVAIKASEEWNMVM
jgi:hypothetical protein